MSRPRGPLTETWFDSRVERRSSPVHGHGLFAAAPFAAGETVMVWGGTRYTADDLRSGRVPPGVSYSYVDEDVLLAGPDDGLDYYLNHSCEPNLWMADEVTLVTRRAVAAGAELLVDYAVLESEPEYRLEPCRCGTAACRGVVTGEDWRRPELQRRYRGHFLPFLDRRIARAAGAPPGGSAQGDEQAGGDEQQR